MIKFIIPLFREYEKITKQYTRLLNNKIVTQYMVETLEEIKKQWKLIMKYGPILKSLERNLIEIKSGFFKVLMKSQR